MKLKNKKVRNLQFNPVSVDKPGTYRWFQSKYQVVNDIVNKTLVSCNTTLSKTALKELHNEVENILGLTQTKVD